MNKFFATICGMLIAVVVQAQIVDNASGIAVLDELGFNEAFIRANKIKSITGEKSVKRESDIIRSSNEIVNYHFDRVGRLVQIEKIRRPGQSSAEINSTIFRYDTEGNLLDKIIADISGATSYSYRYNEKGQVISETCTRMKSPRDTLLPIGPDRTEIYTEYFSYTPLDSGEKKITYNSYRKPYKEEFFWYDELGYLKEHTQRYLMNNKRSKTTYSYNERGLLEQKVIITDLSATDSTTLNYTYDDAGNLLALHEYQNGLQKRRVEFMYTPSNWTLDARLTKVEETQLIRIVRYNTFFRD